MTTPDLLAGIMPYSVPMFCLEGSLALRIPPEYQHPTLAAADQRLFIAPGVSTVMLSWNSTLRAVSNLRWMPLTDIMNYPSGGQWQSLPNLPPMTGGKVSTLTTQITSRYGAVILANIAGTPTAQEVVDGVAMGATIIPSLPYSAG